MNEEYIKSLNLRSVVKRKSCKDNSDVKIRLFSELKGDIPTYRASVSISPYAYKDRFNGNYLAFGVDTNTKKLYMWESDTTEGFKLCHHESHLGNSSYVCTSTDLYRALEGYLDLDSIKTYDLRFDSKADCYYVQLD